jgi:hypothetical protein
MDPKPRPNLQRETEILRRMTPAQRLEKALELGELAREIHLAGMRARHPGLSDDKVRRLAVEERLGWLRETCSSAS